MEPNAIPGFTHRKLARFVARALVSFPETAKWFPDGRHRSDRNAGARRILCDPAQASRRQTHGADHRRQPGFADAESGGAGKLAAVEENVELARAADPSDWSELLTSNSRRVSGWPDRGIEGEISPFLADMPAAFASADVVVSRAGMSTVSELAAAGKPSILVPLPTAADQHQLRNAEAMERIGAARMVLDAEFNGQRLVEEVLRLSQSPDLLACDGRSRPKFRQAGRRSSSRGSAGVVRVNLCVLTPRAKAETIH